MMNDVKISNTKKGVDININGNIKFKDVETLTNNCSEGSYDCCADIKNISVSGEDGNVNIHLTSDKLDAKGVEDCMSNCDCDCGF